MTERRRPLALGSMIALAALWAAAHADPPARAAGDELTDRTVKAWESYSRWQSALGSYQSRGGVAQEVQTLQVEKNRAVTERRSMKAQLDLFPPHRARWNSLHLQFYENWVRLGQRVTEIDARLAELRATRVQLDEADLDEAEMAGGRPRAGNRRALLTDVQRLGREARTAFDALRKAAGPAGGTSPEQAVRGAVAAVSRSRPDTATLVPAEDFLTAYRQFLRGNASTPPARTKRRPRR